MSMILQSQIEMNIDSWPLSLLIFDSTRQRSFPTFETQSEQKANEN